MNGLYRLCLVVLLISIFGMAAIAALLHHRFPMSLGAILVLLPCFLRDVDLLRERRVRDLGAVEWSYLAAGCLWVLLSPLLGA